MKPLPNFQQVHEVVLLDAVEALEAAADGRPRAKITIMRAGPGLNRRNYSAKSLQEAVAAKKYDGVRMFVNHSDKPPIKRPLDEMVSAVESAEWNPKNGKLGAVEGTVVFFKPEFAALAKNAQGYMGASVNNHIRGWRHPDGSVDVTAVESVHSVDWVIYPAAGGELQHFLESEEGDDPMLDWTKITAEDIRKNAPQVMAELAKESEEDPDLKDDDKDDVKLTRASITSIVTEAISAHETAKSAASTARTAALTTATEAIGKSGLPEPVRKRLVTAFSGTATEGITEDAVKKSITDAQEELKALGVGPKLTGQGPSSGSLGEGNKAPRTAVHGSAREGVESMFISSSKKKDDKETTDGASKGAK